MKNTIFESVGKLSVGNDIDVFRDNVRQIMNTLNMSIPEFAEYVDMPLDTMKGFLYHNTTDCRLTQVTRLAEKLGISIEELTGATTLTERERNIIRKLRLLPESVGFYTEFALDYVYEKKPPQKSVVTWILDKQYHVQNAIDMYDVSHLKGSEIHAVNLAIKMPDDFYMPYYSHYDTLLIGSNRVAVPAEMGVYVFDDTILLLKEEGGLLRSILDNSFKHKKEEVTYIGYVLKAERRE